jgi:hypothetical protein
MRELRFLGAILLLISGFFCAVRLARMERIRMERTEGILSLLREIHVQISRFSLPVSRILASLDESLCTRCGFAPGTTALDAALENTLAFFPTEEADMLRALTASLGNGYRAEELAALERAIGRLEARCEQLRADLPRRTRAAQLLPLALSFALVLTLI